MLNLKKFFPFVIILGLLPALVNAQAPQMSREELEHRKRELQREIDEANEALKTTKKSTRESLSQLRALRDKITLRTRLINNINEEINFINGDINAAYRDIKTLEKDLDTLKSQYAQLVVYAYKNRSTYDMLNFIFSAETFNDAIKRYQYLKQYRDYRRRQADNILETRELLSKKIESLQDQKVKRSSTLKVEQEQRTILEVDKKEKDKVLTGLKGREKELLADINKNKKDAQKVQAAIQAAIRREIEIARRQAEEEAAAKRKAAAEEKRRRDEAAKKAAALAAANAAANAAKNNNNAVAENKPETKPAEPAPKPPAPAPEPEKPVRTENVLEATPEALALSESFENNRGKLPWPVASGHIIGHFGRQQHAVIDRITVENDGVIIGTSRGAAVRAIFQGEVRTVAVIPGGGSLVIIRHGQYFTNYARLQSVSVRTGDRVSTGQLIGTAGTNELENLGEVELQIYRGIQKQNPEFWIRKK
ncbi:murein hydrolase activator EnvC family protein [Chitinophaga filiformis]|uniref:Septal ring factor EnvC, activator of murein hydrolases AmiA and AmiB n=1 Tax=Chitinophaga filiformis TaxID=104663 RepID=A0A1G7U6M5_CHIFI|nr:peptidoglycan DD-metalloendopeptidase family protein [Chitinophaga filiformis]SDG42400.1 Septal ring factor EnvC, activator of murein hydrolases AmiA and AmiB [Chitinophaga filiformis]